MSLTESEIGGLMTFNGILLVLFEMPIIYLLIRHKKAMPSIIWGVVLIGLSFLSFNVFGYFWWVAILFMVLISFGEIINFPFTSTVALGRSEATNRGQYMGLYSMIWSVSATISPPIGLKIVDAFSYTHLWNVVGMACTVATIGLIFLSKSYVPQKAG